MLVSLYMALLTCSIPENDYSEERMYSYRTLPLKISKL
jgi:hypothetical protein